MDSSGPRWKMKGFAEVAGSNPMSAIVNNLKAALCELQFMALLSGSDVLFETVDPELLELFSRAAFGDQISSAGHKYWIRLSSEEAFFLCNGLKCLKISRDASSVMSEVDLWNHFTSTQKDFPELYTAYQHLRSKNWVVRSGMMFGADFAAYRHHPALVHSEYAVIVMPESSKRDGRLSVWSDVLCSLRSINGVAKTMLVLSISSSPTINRATVECLEEFNVHERTVSLWIAEECREDKPAENSGAHGSQANFPGKMSLQDCSE